MSFTCPLCRLNKCLQAGMTKQDGRRGRYSYQMKTQTIIRSRQNARAAGTSKQTTQKITTRGPRCGSTGGESSTESSESPGGSDNSPNSCYGDLSTVIDHHVAVIHRNLNKGHKRQRRMQNYQSLPEASSDMKTSGTPSPEVSGISSKHSRRTRTINTDPKQRNNSSNNTRSTENSDILTEEELYHKFLSKANAHLIQKESESSPQRKQADLRMCTNVDFLEVSLEEPEVMNEEQEVTNQELEATSEEQQCDTGTLGDTTTHCDVTNQNAVETSSNSDVTEQELDACVQKLLQVFAQYDAISEETSRMKERAEHQFLQERNLLEELLGKLQPITKEEHLKIYNETGVDIDGRLEEYGLFLPVMKHRLQSQLAFFKALPKFNQLETRDKYALLKGSKMDDFMFSSSVIANTDEEIEYDPRTGKVYGREDDVKLCDDEYFIKMSYRQCKRLQMMRLQEEEFVLLRAVCLYAPDRCLTPEGSAVVESVQLPLADRLHRLMGTNHPDEPRLFARALGLLADFRVYTSIFDYYISDQMMTFRYEIDYPDHLVEFYSPSGQAYDPVIPRENSAPPPNKIKRYLLRGTNQQAQTTM